MAKRPKAKSAVQKKSGVGKTKTTPKKVDPTIKTLQQRDIELTREFDTLATKLAGQGELLNFCVIALQQAKLLPWNFHMEVVEKPRLEAAVNRNASFFPPTLSEKKKSEKTPVQAKGSSPSGKSAPIPPPAMFCSSSQIGMLLVLKAMKGNSSFGYFSKASDPWTHDPKEIRTFVDRAEAEKCLTEIKGMIPAGVKVQISEWLP